MTLEQHILTKLKENKGVLVSYEDLHPYWLNYEKIEEKQGLINQIFTKISKIRKDNQNMRIKTIRMQGYIYEGETMSTEILGLVYLLSTLLDFAHEAKEDNITLSTFNAETILNHLTK